MLITSFSQLNIRRATLKGKYPFNIEFLSQTNLDKVCEVPFKVDLVSEDKCQVRVFDAGVSILENHLISTMMFTFFL